MRRPTATIKLQPQSNVSRKHPLFDSLIGYAQFGHLSALLDTPDPHSGQLINAIGELLGRES